MAREQIVKLLASLNVKTGSGPGELSEDDAVKLAEDCFAAANLGLIQKRDGLLAGEAKLKEKIALLESGAAESAKRAAELEAQLKKNDPQDYKDYYEGLAKTAEAKAAAEMAAVSAERDKYRESHYARVRDDEVNEAVKDFQFVDGLKEGFVALAMQRNRFSPKEIGGKTVFTNEENKTLQAVLHELSLAKEGKAYLKAGNAGGGAAGNGPGVNANGSGGSRISRSQFAGMSDQAKMEFIAKGGTVAEG